MMNDSQLSTMLKLRAILVEVGIAYELGGQWKLMLIRAANKFPAGSSIHRTIKKITKASQLELEYLIDAALAGYRI